MNLVKFNVYKTYDIASGEKLFVGVVEAQDHQDAYYLAIKLHGSDYCCVYVEVADNESEENK